MKAETNTTGSQIGNETRLLAPLRAWRLLPRGREAAGAPTRHSRGLAGPRGQDACSLPGDRSNVPPGLGAALGAPLEPRSPRSRHPLLGFLLPVCFSPRYVPGLDLQRQFPQRLLRQVVAEVIEEVDDVVVSPDVVVPGGGGRQSEPVGAARTVPPPSRPQEDTPLLGTPPPTALGPPPTCLAGNKQATISARAEPHGPAVPSPPLPSAQRRYSRLLEASHAVQDVELLPPFGKVHLPVDIVWVSQVNKGEVLQDKPPGRRERPSHCPGWQSGPARARGLRPGSASGSVRLFRREVPTSELWVPGKASSGAGQASSR